MEISQIERKELPDRMIIISKAERERVTNAFPHVHIVRAKHHYYCEEDRRVMRMLGRETAPERRYDSKKKSNNRRWRSDD